jgi:probable F420-dependent oxidoreductase
MKYGVQLAGGAAINGRNALKQVAAAAEELGFDSMLIGDHIVIPKRINAPWPYDEYVGGKTPYSVYTDMEWFDPFDTMAFLAGVTEKVRLGISVLIVPYRHPFDVARRVATVDVLSGGRFVLGVGVGWLEEEFRLLGIPFKERAQRTREYIAVMKALWTQEKPRFAGKFVQLQEDVNVLPLPIQKPHPPILLILATVGILG